jgi:chloramphenicol 3-O phosphotransferase
MSKTNPHALVLNGASSSGKTTLAKAFLKAAPDYHYLAVDTHLQLLMEAYQQKYMPILAENTEIKPHLIGYLLNGFVLSFHDLILTYLQAGQDVIVDHVLQEPEWRDDLLQKLAAYPVSFVGVFCGLETLEKRERLRRDREIGLAKVQFNRVHRGMNYVLQIETDQTDPEVCLKQLLSLAEAQA